MSSISTNCHIIFTSRGKDSEFLLQAVQVNLASSLRGFYGLCFISQKMPDLDSFAWCDGWRRDQFERFMSCKKASREALRAHEPVAYLESTSGASALTKLDAPKRGRFLTLKLSVTQVGTRLLVERVLFSCVHGSHPLRDLIGTPLLEAKRKELKHMLRLTALQVGQDEKWSLEMDEALVSMVQSICTKLGVRPTSLDAIMLNPGADDYMRVKVLEGASTEQCRARFAILKYLNQLLLPLLHYVDIQQYAKQKRVMGPKRLADGPTELLDEASLSYIVHHLKGVLFMSTKKCVFDALINTGVQTRTGSSSASQARPVAALTINRIKAARAKENPGKDPEGMLSVFGQVFKQLSGKDYSAFRGTKGQQMFTAQFLGEGSTDVGGPYRECLTQMCADLMSSVLPLFIPCPNQKNAVGLNREKFALNPGCRSSLHISMLEFVGALLGIALRTSFSLNINLAGYIWKKLLDLPVDRNDLEAFDKLCVQALDEMVKFDHDKFEVIFDEKFTTQLSNGEEFPLKPGGELITLTHQDLSDYVRLTILARLSEADEQIRAIQKGMHQVIPAHMLTLFSDHDLERMVCGDPDISIDLLRKHTTYRGISASAPLVKNLWKCLESFTSEERQMFLRFVWGRSRLPVSDNDWTQEFQVHLLRAGDDKLPVAHTCFFSLELPNYSSYDILRKKIVFAIFNCLAIDVDFNPNQASLNAWADADAD
eukprot:gb/GEZN01002493.1/.p1 GENE.gb/GEZN01002493.1/~~gb/GEZN01002493.1/.p1  ORF type:complete len:801 (-),score=154.23 gb/GEZN01002493.1/:58-2190(-)